MVRRRGPDNPSAAEAFEEMRADYDAARSSRWRRRRRGVGASASGADWHYRNESDFIRLMELARDMDRNDAIIGQIIDRAVLNTIQDGIRCDPQTGDRKLDEELEARWCEWAEDPEQCDAAGELTFCDIESTVLRAHFVDGDMIVLPLRDEGALQLIEAHRVRTPTNTKQNVVHGVLLDRLTRKRLEYWIAPDDVDPQTAVQRVADMKRYPARDEEGRRQVFHVYHPKRMSQTRGITALHPIFDMLGMLEDINFAKLVQATSVSSWAILRKPHVDLLRGGALGAAPPTGPVTTERQADGTTRTLMGVSPGMEITARPGEEISGFSPGVPNPEYFPHVRLILTFVGINVGMPLVMVLMDAKETNFSGWRGAVDQARMGFRQNQRWLMRRFHQPVRRWKLDQWAADDRAMARKRNKLGEMFYAAQWHCPTWPYIEPKKDAEADALRLEKNLISPRRQMAERGHDFWKMTTEIIEDRVTLFEGAIAAAETLNAAHPEAKVGWRELIGSKAAEVGAKVEAAEQVETPAEDAEVG